MVEENFDMDLDDYDKVNDTKLVKSELTFNRGNFFYVWGDEDG